MVASVSSEGLNLIHRHLEIRKTENSLEVHIEKTEVSYRKIELEFSDTYGANAIPKKIRTFRRWLRGVLEEEFEKFRSALRDFEEYLAKEIFPKAIAAEVLEGALRFSEGSKDLIRPLRKASMDVIDEMMDIVQDFKDSLKEIESLLEEGFDRWEKEGHEEMEVYVEKLMVKRKTVEIDVVV